MKIYVLLVAMCPFVTALAVPDYPAFSWGRVPVYLHFGSDTQLTDEQVEMTAKRSNFICLEKAHGKKTNRTHPERIAGEDAQRIKAANPDAIVLMYWNTLIAWPFTSYNQSFAETHPEDWTLRDLNTGEPLLKSLLGKTPVYQYNLLNPDMREWWVDTVASAVRELGFDGVFMDAISQSKRPIWLKKGWGLGQEDALDAAAIDLITRTKKAMGSDHLLIYNGFRTNAGGSDGAAAAGAEFLPYADGAKIEHFDQFNSSAKEDVLAYWEMADQAAKEGKIVLYKAWPDHHINWLNKEFMAKSPAEKDAFARRKLTYPLACYLIGARKNSYFCYGWGYKIEDGHLIDYPEYSYSLGAPKGNAVRKENSWKFYREFEHANVTVDLEKREGKIEWL